MGESLFGNTALIVVSAGGMILLLVLAASALYALGRLRGMREAVFQMARAIGSHYEHDGESIPERVAKRIDRMKAQVAAAGGDPWGKCRVYSLHLWDLGNVLGEAAWQAGSAAGQRLAAAEDGEIRVDLSLKDLMTIRWLAHFGFENMMQRNEGDLFTFENKEDAQEATDAIERLEFRIPKEHRDQSDPYALSFNRHTMIWDRWPSEKRAQ